jgi:hypothetical protein
MSEIKVNKISPRAACGTVQLGDSGDTITIPAGASITNSGTASGFGATGSASWNTTVKTTDFTAVAGEGYFVNTTSGEVDVTLPAGTAGAVVAVADYANTADTNNIILKQNGSDKIEGSTDDFTINVEGAAITLVFVDATKGWITTDTGNSDNAFTQPFTVATGGNAVVEDGNYKIHIFTSPGTFCVSNIGNTGNPTNADYLVVAGGGGSQYGAGGAGGFRNCVSTCGSLPLSVSSFPITVGAGGAGTPSGCAARGSNSIFSTITSTGGGGSGPSPAGPPAVPASSPGGSGAGGSGSDFPSPSPGSPGATDPQAGGSGNTPPVSPPQGNNGGSGHGTYGTSDNGSGGGGGAGAVGGSTSIGTPGGGPGGAGAPTSIFGSTPTAPSYGEAGPAPGRYFAGGGAGSQQNPGAKSGGVGGGGDAPGASGTGADGATNMGGGGGARRGSGGSGIVVIRYKFQ